RPTPVVIQSAESGQVYSHSPVDRWHQTATPTNLDPAPVAQIPPPAHAPPHQTKPRHPPLASHQRHRAKTENASGHTSHPRQESAEIAPPSAPANPEPCPPLRENRYAPHSPSPA